MIKLSKKTLEYMRIEREKRLEKNVIEYPEEYEIYNEVLEQLIIELDIIEDWWMYSVESIKERLEEKIENIDDFDRILEWCGK